MQSEVYDKRAVLSWDGGGDAGARLSETAGERVKLDLSFNVAPAFLSYMTMNQLLHPLGLSGVIHL